jgi:UPF0755 protein
VNPSRKERPARTTAGQILRRIGMVTVVMMLASCGGEGAGEPVRVHVPAGASFSQVTDSLANRDIIDAPAVFKLYARVRSATGSVKPGTYAFRRGTSWSRILDDLSGGRVLTARVVIPEAWDLRGIAPRIATATGLDEDSVIYVLTDTAVSRRLGVPGPTLEGYLYPATYTFPVAAPLDTILMQMIAAYRRVWTPGRRARADSMGLDEREVVTLASIVEKEARQRDEMPTISAVYHNRLKRGQRLEADPTVQYALGEHQQRLLYAHIDSVAGNPYNTYRHAGLPPGPIGSPSSMGIDAALYPADVNYLYFVARPDGSHVFTRTFAEHTRARAMVRRLQREQAVERPSGSTVTPPAAPPGDP